MKRLSFFLLALLAGGCGQRQEQVPPPAATPYGSPQEITAYLQAIDPLIQQMGAIQREVDQAIGTSGTATGKNLAPAMEQGRPRLQQLLAELEKVSPPPLLAPFHAQIKKLMVLGIDAYGTTIEGWRLEQERNARFESLYAQGEQQLAEAKKLSEQLNEEMQKIQQALIQAAQAPQAASR